MVLKTLAGKLCGRTSDHSWSLPPISKMLTATYRHQGRNEGTRLSLLFDRPLWSLCRESLEEGSAVGLAWCWWPSRSLPPSASLEDLKQTYCEPPHLIELAYQKSISDVFILKDTTSQSNMLSFPKQCGHTEGVLTVKVKKGTVLIEVGTGAGGIFPANFHTKWPLCNVHARCSL